MKKIVFNLLLTFGLAYLFTSPALAQDLPLGVRQGATLSFWTAEGCAIDGVATIQGIRCVLIRLTQFIVPLIILSAILMILFAGARIIAGADDPKAVAQGKQTLVFAVIGLIGILGAWVILVLIQEFTGAQVTRLDTIAPF